MRSTFTFNGHKCDEFGIYISKKPNINRSQRKFQSASVAGRNGNIYQFQDAWDEVVVTYDIFAGGYEQGDAPRDFTAIMEWLNSADDYARLEDSFDEDHYRMAVFVDATNIEQKWYSTGQAQIKFRCKPQHYLVGEVVSVEGGDTITNPTNHTALPIITMKGTGTRSQLSLLNKTMANYELVVGTAQLYGLVSDALNGKVFWVWPYPATSTTRIRYIGGNDSQLNLNNATGQVGATSTDTTRGLGFILPVTPNAEYTISANAISNNSKIRIWYGASGGYNDILGMEEASASGLKIQHAFKTPAECGYILIAFYRTDGTGILFSNVMLSTGSEAKTFKAYSTPVQTDFTIGNVTLSMLSEGFDTAEINCERENLTIDGVEKNNIASIIDQFGNVSVDFLQLIKGDNAVAFTGDIDSVVLDPRFWEL